MDTRDAIDQTTRAVAQQADELLRQGARVLSDGSDQMRDRAIAVSDAAADYVRREPMSAVLIAALSGAVLAGLVGLLNRSRR